MQELRIVAVSEDGSYAVLAVPGRGGRFSLPIDDRLRIVARGQFSRLAQYEIEVESPLRPKEIQDRIRAGETAEEIADAAGVPIERVRRFEGPVLAERAYRAQEAQGATIRQPGDSGPGPRLGDIVAERLAELGVPAEEAQWDSRKRGDNTWQVQLMFTVGGRPQMAEWSFDPRRRHVSPIDDDAARLSLPEADVAALGPSPIAPMRATVTPIGSRLAPAPAAEPAPPPAPAPERGWAGTRPGPPPHPAQPRPAAATASPAQASPAQGSPAQPSPAPGHGAASHGAASHGAASHGAASHGAASHGAASRSAPGHGAPAGTAAAAAGPASTGAAPAAPDPAAPDQADQGSPDRPEQAPAAETREPATAQRGRARKAAGGRSRRSSVPSWDEIMFGTSRQPD
jgi:hypothetical protein